MMNNGHKFNVVGIKEDFSILKCEQCEQFFIILNTAILDVSYCDMMNFKTALIETIRNFDDDYCMKYLVSVSGFKKIQLYLSHKEITSLIELIKEVSIILETNSILLNLNQ